MIKNNAAFNGLVLIILITLMFAYGFVVDHVMLIPASILALIIFNSIPQRKDKKRL